MHMMKCVAALVTLLGTHGLACAGQFDGDWQGTVPGNMKCERLGINYHFTVKDNDVSGTTGGSQSSSGVIKGTIGPDGAFTAESTGDRGSTGVSGKFSADKVDVVATLACGRLTGTATRVKQ